VNVVRLIITKHARDMMFERGIDENQIKRVIQFGSKTKQTKGYLSIHTYIGVAYKKLNNDVYKIKTVMIYD